MEGLFRKNVPSALLDQDIFEDGNGAVHPPSVLVRPTHVNNPPPLAGILLWHRKGHAGPFRVLPKLKIPAVQPVLYQFLREANVMGRVKHVIPEEALFLGDTR